MGRKKKKKKSILGKYLIERNRGKVLDNADRGFYAEVLVMTKLAKRGICSIKLPPQFDYDLFCNNNIRIEVRSSHSSTRRWNFPITKNNNPKSCDFYVLVGFEDDKPPKFFIIPEKILHRKKGISFLKKSRKGHGSRYKRYIGKWTFITHRFLKGGWNPSKKESKKR